MYALAHHISADIAKVLPYLLVSDTAAFCAATRAHASAAGWPTPHVRIRRSVDPRSSQRFRAPGPTPVCLYVCIIITCRHTRVYAFSHTRSNGSVTPGESTATADVFVSNRLPIESATEGFRSSFGLQDAECGPCFLDILSDPEGASLMKWIQELGPRGSICGLEVWGRASHANRRLAMCW